jgi:hypothetical protein
MARRKVYAVPADQSAAARKKRFYEDGGCPIHGGVMSQADRWYVGDAWGDYTIVGCSRNSCNVESIAFSFMGPWELLPQHAHLLADQGRREETRLAPSGDSVDSPIEHRSHRKSKARRKIWPIPDDQTVTARKKRIYDEGLCPIHGEYMHQVDGWFHDEMKRKYTIIGCGKNDCPAKARMFSMIGPWELLPECANLIDENALRPPRA